jgi:hypothetical protein
MSVGLMKQQKHGTGGVTMADVKWRQWNSIPNNGDLISRAAIIADLDELHNHCGHCDGYGYISKDKAMQKVKAAPAVDAVEVVRCKDCVVHGNCLTEDTFRIARVENPYCCAGKRRTDADN